MVLAMVCMSSSRFRKLISCCGSVLNSRAFACRERGGALFMERSAMLTEGGSSAIFFEAQGNRFRAEQATSHHGRTHVKFVVKQIPYIRWQICTRNGLTRNVRGAGYALTVVSSMMS